MGSCNPVYIHVNLQTTFQKRGLTPRMNTGEICQFYFLNVVHNSQLCSCIYIFSSRTVLKKTTLLCHLANPTFALDSGEPVGGNHGTTTALF